MVKLIYCSILTSLVFALSAQPPPVFHHLTIEDGLAQNTVTAIAQDNRGFMWLGTPNGLSRFDSKEFKNYRHNPKFSGSISSDYVHALLYDSKGTLWVGTNEGLNRYNPNTDSFDKFQHKPDNKNSIGNSIIRSIYEDHKGRIWLATNNGITCIVEEEKQIQFIRYLDNYAQENDKKLQIHDFAEDTAKNLWCVSNYGLIKLDPDQNPATTHFFFPDPSQKDYFSNSINDIAVGQDSQLMLGTANGKLYTFDPETEQFSRFPTLVSGSEPFSIIYEIVPCRNGKFWIGTNNGLFLINPETKQIQEFMRDATNHDTLSDNNVLSLFEDKQHTVWVGTYYGGINYTYAGKNAFKSLPIQPVNSRHVILQRIIKDPQGKLWFSSFHNNLMSFDKAKEKLIPFPLRLPDEIKFREVYLDRDGLLWIGTSENKIMSYDMRTNAYHTFETPVSDGKISAIRQDADGLLWICTTNYGIYTLNKKTNAVIRYTTDKNSPIRLANNSVTSLLFDTRQNTWIGTIDGVQLIHPDKSTQWFPTIVKAQASSYKGSVNTIHEDARGRIWIGTFYKGLKRYDATRKAFVACKGLEAYADALITNILSDKDGYLWLSHESGLLRYHPEKETVQKYDFSEGLTGQDIVPNGAIQDADGEMFFCTNENILHFYPNLVQVNTDVPQVVFTQLKLFNRPVAVGDSSKLLNKDISSVNRIIFRHDQSIFTINFAVLNFIKPQKNQYAYMLEGFESNWNYVKNPTATYTNLPVGTYTLLIKGANNDGIWNPTPTRLSITVLPPWWKTDFAYVMYCLITGLTLFLVIRFFWLRESFQKETELYQAKLDFFTNISHEIRTHLTLISGPIDSLLTLRKDDAEVQRMMGFTKKNTNLLLKLVSELLDFSKLQSGLVRLNITENELIPFLKNIISSVDYLFIEKGIKLNFITSTENIKLWFDAAQLQKVIYNLLINAYKFTPKGGSVSMTVSQTPSQVHIKITDNGIGISPEYLNKIFSNFFQIFDNGSQNTGYGIGLALSRSIIELHKGELLVDSQTNQPENRTCFTIGLLKGNSHLDAYLIQEKLSETTEPEPLEAENKELPELKTNKILLVEDNPELRAFIKEVLGKNYEITEATNGKEAWEIVTSDIPDVVVSDIMMAEIDGLELCRKIKADFRTNHIPVIILTAKSGITHEIEGLNAGADIYLAKPFNVELLLLRLKNLLENRRLLQQKYYQSIMTETDSQELSHTHDKFLNNIIEAVETQIAEQNFSVHQLSHMAGMSLTVLYKKLKAVTGMTVNDFVKSVQMNKAARLLRTTDLTVSEISYKVGFEDRKYFSKEFKKRFGKTPSEYAIDNRVKA